LKNYSGYSWRSRDWAIKATCFANGGEEMNMASYTALVNSTTEKQTSLCKQTTELGNNYLLQHNQ